MVTADTVIQVSGGDTSNEIIQSVQHGILSPNIFLSDSAIINHRRIIAPGSTSGKRSRGSPNALTMSFPFFTSSSKFRPDGLGNLQHCVQRDVAYLSHLSLELLPPPIRRLTGTIICRICRYSRIIRVIVVVLPRSFLLLVSLAPASLPVRLVVMCVRVPGCGSSAEDEEEQSRHGLNQ